MHARRTAFRPDKRLLLVALVALLLAVGYGWLDSRGVGFNQDAPALSAKAATPTFLPAGAGEAVAKSFSTSGVVAAAGAMRGLDERAMGLVRGVTLAVSEELPDPDAALKAVETFFSEQEAEIAALAEELKRVRENRSEVQRSAYAHGLRLRFAGEISAYERALATFEEHASDAQIFELNSLMRTLANALGTE